MSRKPSGKDSSPPADSILLDTLPVGVYHTSVDGRILRANRQLALMFGYDTPDELLDLKAFQLYQRPEDALDLREALAQRDVISQRRRKMVCRDGSHIWVEETVRALRDTDGKLTGLQGILQDVSEAQRARDALSRSEAMYRSLFQNAGDALMVLDGYRFIDCNRATRQIFMVEREEVLQSHPWDLSPPSQPNGESSREMAQRRIKAALAGRPQFFSWIHSRGDGSHFPAEVSLVRVDIDGRRLVQVRVHDTTRRKRVMEELSARERVLEAVSLASTLFLSSIPWRDSIEEVLDRLAKATEASGAVLLAGDGHEPGCYASPGFSAAMELKEALSKVADPGVLARLIRSDSPFSGGCSGLPGGLAGLAAECCRSCLAMPVRVEGLPWGCLIMASSREESFPQPVVDACVIAARLISAAVSAERYRNNLAMEKEKLEVTLSAIEDAVITTDLSGRILLYNRAAENLTDIPSHTACGSNLLDSVRLESAESREPLCWDGITRLGTKSLEEGGRMAMDCLLGRTGKDHRPMRLSVRCLSYPAAGFVLILRDTTWERRLAEEKARSQRLESLGVLAGGIAHDFNNSLTAILSGLELSKLRPDPEGKQDILQEVERAAVSARGLTRQLLTFSRGGAPVARPMQVTEMIRETAGFVLSGTNCNLDFRAESELWPVQADEAQISQVVNNLVLNARQSMPSGGTIGVHLSNTELRGNGGLPLSQGRYVRIVISDQGTGIPEELLSRIFDPYFTTKGEGSGLGLATTHSIVSRHGGHIKVESSPGEGTTFTLLLPAAEEKPQTTAALPQEDRLFGRVLLMDDDRSVRRTASQLIEALGCEVEVTPEGRSAIQAYGKALSEDRRFDAVIMDLTVQGGMGGAAAAREITDMDPSARLVVSSGYSNDPVMADFADYGFVDCIAKPYTMRELHALLARVLRTEED